MYRLKSTANQIRTSCIFALVTAFLLTFTPSVKADTSIPVQTKAITLGESQSQQQSGSAMLPGLSSIKSVTSNTGNATYTLSGNMITVTANGGTPSRTYTPSKQANGSQTRNDTSFPSTIGYSDGTYSGNIPQSGSYSTNNYGNYLGVMSGYFWWYASDTDVDAATPPYPGDYIGGASTNGYGGGNPSDWPAEYQNNYISWNGDKRYWQSVGQYVRQAYVEYRHYSPNHTQQYAGTVYAATQYYYTYKITVSYYTKAPALSLTQSGWSASTVTVTAKATDNSGAGLSAQKWASGSQAISYFQSNGTNYSGSFSATENGTYTAYVKDNYGNEATQTITVDHIDKTAPTGSYTLSPSSITTQNVIISVTGSDAGSGVTGITCPDNTVVSGSKAYYTATGNGTYHFKIKDAVGNTYDLAVPVTNIDRTISVTHPVSVSYTIDPNSNTPFTAPDIPLTNHSTFPIKVSVSGLKATSGIGNTAPASYSDWNSLTTAQTQSGIALGVAVKESATGSATWASISQTSPLYATQIGSGSQLGVLNAGGTGHLAISAKYGLAWSSPKTISHQLVLRFDQQ